MAVAVPRVSPAPRKRSRPRPVVVEDRPKRRVTTHRSNAARTAVSGRLAPFRIASIIAIVGVALSLVVYLQVSSLRATMQAGSLRTQIEATHNDAANIQNETDQRLADGRVERAAAGYGMVLVPSQAMRMLPITVPKDRQAS